jgi:Zn-dependent peptidase ImmA (M78 family)
MINKHIEDQTFNLLQNLGIKEPSDIDVFKIAEHLNVDVQSAQLGSDISGLFVIKENKSYIRFNENEADARQKFTIAHELGHFVLHKDTPLFVDRNEKIMFRNLTTGTGEARKEREANSFAASLLMPQKFIERELGKIPPKEDTVSYLARIFNVSTQAMSFRLSNLGYDFGLF